MLLIYNGKNSLYSNGLDFEPNKEYQVDDKIGKYLLENFTKVFTEVSLKVETKPAPKVETNLEQKVEVKPIAQTAKGTPKKGA